MQITGVDIRKLYNGPSSLKAIVSITLDGELAVHDIKVIHGPRNFIQMPSDRREEYRVSRLGSEYNRQPSTTATQVHNPKDEFRSVVHPIRREFRGYLEDTILHMYDVAVVDYESMTEEERLQYISSTGGVKRLDTAEDEILKGIRVSYRVPSVYIPKTHVSDDTKSEDREPEDRESEDRESVGRESRGAKTSGDPNAASSSTEYTSLE